MRCSKCGSGENVEMHHVDYRSEGGVDAPENMTALCRSCHVELHSGRGDWSRWGAIGGKASAARLHFLNNLKQFKNPAVKQAYLERVAVQR